MKKATIVLFSILVSGCLPEGNFRITETGAPDSFSVPVITAGNCGADQLQGLMGQTEAALEGVNLPGGARIIRPGTVYTHDVVGSRLNIGIASNGVIVHVACG